METTTTKSLTLYELTAQQAAIEEALIENGGELTPELEDMMNETGEALSVKLDGYNRIIRRFEGSEAAIDGEIKRLQAMKKTAQASQKSIKSHLLWVMQQNGVQKLDGELCKASIRTTTALDVDEDTLLAQYDETIASLTVNLPAYIKPSFKIDKTTLKQVFPKGSAALPAGCQYTENASVTIR